MNPLARRQVRIASRLKGLSSLARTSTATTRSRAPSPPAPIDPSLSRLCRVPAAELPPGDECPGCGIHVDLHVLISTVDPLRVRRNS